jgi:hypothetical protein
MRSKTNLRARERKQKWYMQVMEKLQNLSIAMRPQAIRALWVRDVVKKAHAHAQEE